MEQENSKKILVAGVIMAAVAIAGYFLFVSPANGPGVAVPAESKLISETPKVTEEQLLGNENLLQGQQSDIEKHKQDILALVNSGKTFTDDEKSTIGNIMLTRAHLYNFTDEERETVFSALRR